jgi:hypothetical protein
MTQEEIIEGNRLIAEFMGAIDNTHDWGFMLKKDELNLSFDLFDEKIYSNDGGSGWYIKDLKYHLSWEWLMDVFEKIGDTYLDGMQLSVQISGSKGYYSCTIFGTHVYADNEDPKTAVWNCVVKFIKWYNKQKEKE